MEQLRLKDSNSFVTVKPLVENTIFSIVKNIADVEKITTKLFKYDIKTAYLNNLIALYSKSPYAFAGSCNEIIFSSVTFEPLCVPPRILAEIPVIMTPDYTITKINDGTMVNLYYNAGQWYLSSAHSYDIGDKYFMGNKNYCEMFYESLPADFIAKTGCVLTESKRLNFSNLSSEYSYTFIFHHPNVHIIGDHGIWQVQSVNLKTLEVSYNYFDTIPMQETVKVIDNTSLYGYICRNGKYDFIIRSPFLNFLRNAVYTVPKNVELNHNNRYQYIVTRAYMTPIYRDYFKSLSPVAEMYEKIENLISDVTAAVINIMKPKTNVVFDEKIVEIAKKIIGSITDQEMFKQVGSKDVQSVISDYCNNAAFAHFYIV